jgi:hypothetical protein
MFLQWIPTPDQKDCDLAFDLAEKTHSGMLDLAGLQQVR